MQIYAVSILVMKANFELISTFEILDCEKVHIMLTSCSLELIDQPYVII
jgi:hypothetical protein